MPVNLTEANPALPSHRQRVPYGERVFGVRFTYRKRLLSWYVDLFDADGDEILVGQRLAPQFSPTAGFSLDAAPDSDGAAVIVSGPTDYARDDLGDALRLVYIDAEDVPLTTPTSEYTVTLS